MKSPQTDRRAPQSRQTRTALLVAAMALMASTGLATDAKTTNSTNPEIISPACINGLAVEQARIERVSDGDTVVLSDNRRVRLIGINSAELNAPNAQLRQAAEEAASKLGAWLPVGEPVLLFIGTESHDRYDRLLAHVVREKDNLAVAQLMVQKGLAVQSAVAPNTRCATQFAKLESVAADAQSGLWAIRDLMSIDANALNKKSGGFKFISGTVTSVTNHKRYSEVFLDETLRLLVRPKLSRQLSVKNLLGQRIEVRGWISQRKSQAFMWLQHPANLRRLGN